MDINKLENKLTSFSNWKARNLRTLKQLEPWLKQQGLFTSEAQRAIHHAINTLQKDHISVAFVGEFSRGKTELINALFFGDHDARLLPTDAGRTTMCPTEIFEDSSQRPFIRLLPIETRLQDTSLVDLMQARDRWLELPLKMDDPEQLHQALQKVKESRTVSPESAAKLGLHTTPQEPGNDLNRVQIPRWRLAQINFRHPLLAQGLRILDTPGLNTVGSEPELTYEILPNTQARLFVLGADTGVTQSDLQMWEEFIKHPGTKQKRGVMIILNKTDTLWDELRSNEETQQSIRNQTREVANILDVSQKQIFAVSAQKALLSRIKKDPQLEMRSGIRQLEKHLAETLVANRQDLIIEQSTEYVCSAINTIEALVTSRLKRMQKQEQGLRDLSTKSETAIDRMLKKTQADKDRYQQSVNAYKESRQSFAKHGRVLLNALSLHDLEKVIARARKEMSGAWTTYGLKEAMRILFDDISERMKTASDQSQEMRRLIRTIHRRFQTQHDMALGDPMMFSIISHQVELNLVHQESEIFRKSPRTTLTEQHFAVRRYFQTIVHRTQQIFRSAHNDATDWLDTALDPLTMQIQEHRYLLADQLNDLKHAGQSRVTVKQRISTLRQDTKQLKTQLAALKKVSQALSSRSLPAKESAVRGRTVKKSA